MEKSNNGRQKRTNGAAKLHVSYLPSVIDARREARGASFGDSPFFAPAWIAARGASVSGRKSFLS